MNVQDIMTAAPITVTPRNSLYDVLTIMTEMEFHHMPVVSAGGHLIGVITATDCRVALKLHNINPETWLDNEDAKRITVRQVMTAAPIIVEPQTRADEAARLMLENHIGCLPVMRGETLVGIVTVSDVLVAFIAFSHRRDFILS